MKNTIIFHSPSQNDYQNVNITFVLCNCVHGLDFKAVSAMF